MKILIIYAHPNPKSFNSALLESFLKGAKAAKHDIKVIDLYKDDFNPVLSNAELHREMQDDVKKYQEMIEWADYMVFIFPIFWYRAPAMLEGWFDRVLTSGFAYRYIPFIGSFKRPVGLLPCQKALVINTYGGPKWYYLLVHRFIIWRRLKYGVLRFCGIKKLRHFGCYYAPYTSDVKRKKWLRQVEELATKL